MNKLTTPEIQKVRFVYTVSNGRRTTVAYVYDDSNSAIKLDYAECSDKDQFVKKIGRDIAFGRLVTNGGISVPFSVIGGSTYNDIAKFVTKTAESGFASRHKDMRMAG